jgi:mannose/fructose/N-acetylgalactosamine-specific phosphotransferase system component IIB
LTFFKKIKNLVRVDDRLIHGQVSVGWAPGIDPKYIIIADDEISLSEEDKELYLLGVPFEYEGKVFSVKEAAAFLNSHENENFIVVLKNLQSALDLYHSGYKFEYLNIGGLHLSEGKEEINHYIFMNEKDIYCLRRIEDEGIKVFIQDLPVNTRYGTESVYRKWKKIRER